MLQEPHRVGARVSLPSIEVGVELAEQRGHRYGERASVVLQRRLGGGIGVMSRRGWRNR